MSEFNFKKIIKYKPFLLLTLEKMGLFAMGYLDQFLFFEDTYE